MSARFIVGDALTELRKLPSASVDLVMTSPAFLALRSYLPADHPQKHLEMGSEATPGAYLDVLLDVVEECRRVLAPHGSLVFELGDTYAGSGGAGGDYLNAGMRDGQPKFDGSSARNRAIDRAASYDGGGSDHHDFAKPGTKSRAAVGAGWPLDKSLTGIPELFMLSLTYGRNLLTGRQIEPWRVRNFCPWVRPNPPVGALGDKLRPATSYLTVACTARDRWFDLDAVREKRDRAPHTDNRGGHNRDGIPGRTGQVMNPVDENGHRIQENAAGAPPLDWFNIPTAPYKGAHYATYPPDLVVPFIKSMCPQRVCRVCGEPSRRIVRSETEATAAGARQPELAAHIKERREALGITTNEVNRWFGYKEIAKNWERTDSFGARIPSPVHWLVLKQRLGLSDEFDTLVFGERRWTHSESLAEYENYEGERIGTRRSDYGKGHSQTPGLNKSMGRRLPVEAGWTDCGHDNWRPGLCLDPFAGSGTTLQVATGHGRDAIGIDLDARNAELAQERCGMFLTVEYPPPASEADTAHGGPLSGAPTDESAA